jgi:hypothetical protein
MVSRQKNLFEIEDDLLAWIRAEAFCKGDEYAEIGAN